MTNKPRPTLGMRHLALLVSNFEGCERFYTECIGLTVEWRPDPDNVYLTSGHDNVALHRAPEGFEAAKAQRLDHLGFIIESPEQVDVWFDYLKSLDVPMSSEPKTHRDGARSFYCADPDGNHVQMIYHPPLVV